ncbi:unnamed protein product [Amoebophrya sp. A120]|nr:unnamed protein product [Amoebophrya sp. A120]|eukprot:GSA120T00018735001.1
MSTISVNVRRLTLDGSEDDSFAVSIENYKSKNKKDRFRELQTKVAPKIPTDDKDNEIPPVLIQFYRFLQDEDDEKQADVASADSVVQENDPAEPRDASDGSGETDQEVEPLPRQKMNDSPMHGEKENPSPQRSAGSSKLSGKSTPGKEGSLPCFAFSAEDDLQDGDVLHVAIEGPELRFCAAETPAANADLFFTLDEYERAGWYYYNCEKDEAGGVDPVQFLKCALQRREPRWSVVLLFGVPQLGLTMNYEKPRRFFIRNGKASHSRQPAASSLRRQKLMKMIEEGASCQLQLEDDLHEDDLCHVLTDWNKLGNDSVDFAKTLAGFATYNRAGRHANNRVPPFTDITLERYSRRYATDDFWITILRTPFGAKPLARWLRRFLLAAVTSCAKTPLFVPADNEDAAQRDLKAKQVYEFFFWVLWCMREYDDWTASERWDVIAAVVNAPSCKASDIPIREYAHDRVPEALLLMAIDMLGAHGESRGAREMRATIDGEKAELLLALDQKFAQADDAHNEATRRNVAPTSDGEYISYDTYDLSDNRFQLSPFGAPTCFIMEQSEHGSGHSPSYIFDADVYQTSWQHAKRFMRQYFHSWTRQLLTTAKTASNI